ncbi:unnamed protein product [Dovyalis caffra]|uniref:LysM domain-containing protein n=1 Tax=Dovyalis caffra TaxID=77055 RepID=A0AAV1SHJ4_9ROSI|nr:unnamed protein product [Dovyalis caffra]
MVPQGKLLSLLLPSLLLFVFPCTTTHAKSVIEPCSSSDSCTSLLSYILPYDSKLSEIAYRFQVNISDISAANSINPTTSFLSNQIFHAKSIVKIPIPCPCVDGIRRSISTTYTVRAADTAEFISEGYGGLVSPQQIMSANGVDARNPLMSGQTLLIPLPCTCFNNSDNGIATVYMSYVVQSDESLGSIAMEFDTTVMDLEAVNGLGQPVVDPGDVLAIPISVRAASGVIFSWLDKLFGNPGSKPQSLRLDSSHGTIANQLHSNKFTIRLFYAACSSANLNWHNETLIVPNGSYALTANDCIKCICEPGSLNLQCLPSGIESSCSHLQCKDSDLFIGDTYVENTSIGCNITACEYRGHYGRKIFRSLVNSSYVQCPGDRNCNATCPSGSPLSNNPDLVPSIALPPVSSPSPAPCPNMGIDGSNPRNRKSFNISSNEELLKKASWCTLLLLEVVYYFFLL